MNQDSTLYKVLRVIFIIVIVVVLFLIAFGIVKLIPRALTALSNIKGTSTSTPSGIVMLNVSPDKTVVRSGEPFMLRVIHSSTIAGTYSFQYECSDVANYELVRNASVQAIQCGQRFSLPVASTTNTLDRTEYDVILRPLLNQNLASSTSSQVKSNFQAFLMSSTDRSIIAMGTSSINIKLGTEINPPSTMVPHQHTAYEGGDPAEASVAPQTTHTSEYQEVIGGTPDLSVTLVKYGILNQNHQFVSLDTLKRDVTSSDIAAVRFEVQNIGSAVSGSWNFNATLPSSDVNNQSYASPSQKSLKPGDGIIFTLGYTSPTKSFGSITVDQNAKVNDINRSNNTLNIGQ